METNITLSKKNNLKNQKRSFRQKLHMYRYRFSDVRASIAWLNQLYRPLLTAFELLINENIDKNDKALDPAKISDTLCEF